MAGARKLLRGGQASRARLGAKPPVIGGFEALLWETLERIAMLRARGFPYAARLR
jgi:hypothetical protein